MKLVRSRQGQQEIVIVATGLDAPRENIRRVEVEVKSTEIFAHKKLQHMVSLPGTKSFCHARGWDLGGIAERDRRKRAALMNNSPLRPNHIVTKSVLAGAADVLAGSNRAVPANFQIAEHCILEQIADVALMDALLLPRATPTKFGLDDSDLSYVSGVGDCRPVGVRGNRSIRRTRTLGQRGKRCG